MDEAPQAGGRPRARREGGPRQEGRGRGRARPAPGRLLHRLLPAPPRPQQEAAPRIADAVRDTLRAEGRRPDHVEGYPRQEWILLDYGSFVVHIFTPRTRSFYDLE